LSEPEKKFVGKTYSEFKSSLAELIMKHFEPFHTKKKTLLASAKGGSASGGKSSILITTLVSGSKKAAKVAEKKISEVKKKIGIAVA